jgi:hypothetical protein
MLNWVFGGREEKFLLKHQEKGRRKKAVCVESRQRSNQSKTQLTVDRIINYYFHEFLFWSDLFNLKSYFIYFSSSLCSRCLGMLKKAKQSLSTASIRRRRWYRVKFQDEAWDEWGGMRWVREVEWDDYTESHFRSIRLVSSRTNPPSNEIARSQNHLMTSPDKSAEECRI